MKVVRNALNLKNNAIFDKNESKLFHSQTQASQSALKEKSDKLYGKSVVSYCEFNKTTEQQRKNKKKKDYKRRVIRDYHESEDRYQKLKRKFDIQDILDENYLELLDSEENKPESSFNSGKLKTKFSVKSAKFSSKLKNKEKFSIYRAKSHIKDKKKKKKIVNKIGEKQSLITKSDDEENESEKNKRDKKSKLYKTSFSENLKSKNYSSLKTKKANMNQRKNKDFQKRFYQKSKIKALNSDTGKIFQKKLYRKNYDKIYKNKYNITSKKIKKVEKSKDSNYLKKFNGKSRIIYYNPKIRRGLRKTFNTKISSPKLVNQHFALSKNDGIENEKDKKRLFKKAISNQLNKSFKDNADKSIDESTTGKHSNSVENEVIDNFNKLSTSLAENIFKKGKKSLKEARVKKKEKKLEKLSENSLKVENKLQFQRNNSKVANESAMQKNLKKIENKSKRDKLIKQKRNQEIKKKRKKKHQRKLNQKIYRNTIVQETTQKAKKAAKRKLMMALLKKKILMMLGAVLLGVLAFLAIITMVFVGMSVFMTGQAEASFVSSDISITSNEAYYTEKEILLNKSIKDTKIDYPDYSDYKFNIAPMGHDPQLLTAYLTVKFNDYTYKSVAVKEEIDSLFQEQYSLKREKIEVDENVYELHTTLLSKSFEEVIRDRVAEMNEKDQQYFQILTETMGCYTNLYSPFARGTDWKSLLTSQFGLRLNPKGEKDSKGRVKTEMHNGIDFAVPEGTPLYAMTDGEIIDVGENSEEGKYITLYKRIPGGNEWKITYKHLSSTVAGYSQKIKERDLIAYSGNTGDSTGPHLHLEMMQNGKFINPYFYLKSDGIGTPSSMTSPGTSDLDSLYPGLVPKYDGKFPDMEELPPHIASLIDLAMKQLGKPYVWGAEGPDSFDCSGFICWIFTESHVKNMPRTTARGIASNYVKMIPSEDAKPGDLIFFRDTNPDIPGKISHIGLYIGNGLMIHASYGQKKVVIARIDTNYFKKHFAGFGRP